MAEFYGDPATTGSGGGDPDPSPPTLTVDTTTTLVTGTISGKDHHNRAKVDRLNSGRLVLLWHDSTAHTVNDGALHIKFSDDDGTTWSTTDQLPDTTPVDGFPMNPSTLISGQDAGEPMMYHMPGSDKLILHMWRVDYGVSVDGTWQSECSDGTGETWTTSHGHVDFTYSTATTSTQTRTFATDDYFVDPDTDDIYAAARIYTSATAYINSNFALMRSTDEGVTWERVSLIVSVSENSGHGAIESGLEYLGSGKIIALLTDGSRNKSFKRVSTDMGATWGPLIDTTASMGIAGRVRVYTAAHLRGEASWETDTNLVAQGFVNQTPGSSFSRRIAVWLSTDAGDTWSAPQYLDTTAEDGGYGDLFYEGSAGKYGVINYRGTQTAADLKQYDLTITGIG